MNDLTKAALENLGSQLGEALFNDPGMTLVEVANRRDEVSRSAKDAQRYRWLRDRLRSASFESGDSVEITFGLPLGSIVTASLNDTIDAAIGGKA